jgi:hypothetical protein
MEKPTFGWAVKLKGSPEGNQAAESGDGAEDPLVLEDQVEDGEQEDGPGKNDLGVKELKALEVGEIHKASGEVWDHDLIQMIERGAEEIEDRVRINSQDDHDDPQGYQREQLPTVDLW